MPTGLNQGTRLIWCLSDDDLDREKDSQDKHDLFRMRDRVLRPMVSCGFSGSRAARLEATVGEETPEISAGPPGSRAG
jgi:hypothetical protein